MNAQRFWNLGLLVAMLILASIIGSQHRTLLELESRSNEQDRLLAAQRSEIAVEKQKTQEAIKAAADSAAQAVASQLDEASNAKLTGNARSGGVIKKRVGPNSTTSGSNAQVLSLDGNFIAPTTTRTREEVEAMLRERPNIAGKGLSWSNNQAVGPPDTSIGGDYPTAWAPRRPRSGEQWLQVGYKNAVEIGAINVHETYNPGALSKVTAIMPDGSERTLWHGTAPGGEAPVETSIPVPKGITSDKIKLYVDTDRVSSWPEIDAVELVGTNGSKQWATSSTASSHFGDVDSYLGD